MYLPNGSNEKENITMVLNSLTKLGFMPYKKTTLEERNTRDTHFAWLVEKVEREQYITLAETMKVSPIELQYYALKLISARLNAELNERESQQTCCDDEFCSKLFPME